jgi:hypothetical protein
LILKNRVLRLVIKSPPGIIGTVENREPFGRVDMTMTHQKGSTQVSRIIKRMALIISLPGVIPVFIFPSPYGN